MIPRFDDDHGNAGAFDEQQFIFAVDKAIDDVSNGSLNDRLIGVAQRSGFTIGELLQCYYKLTGIQIILFTGE